MKLNKPTKAEMKFLKSFYPEDFMDSVVVMKGKELLFIFTKPEDFHNLTQKHIEVLYLLENQEDLESPVFVELDGQTLCVE